jgi:hypothetical protein
MKKNEKKTVKASKVPAKKATKLAIPKPPYKSVKELARLCLAGEKPSGVYLTMRANDNFASFVCGPKKAPYAVAVDISVALEEIAKSLGIKVVHVS